VRRIKQGQLENEDNQNLVGDFKNGKETGTQEKEDPSWEAVERI
jgi:hypothetical protein